MNQSITIPNNAQSLLDLNIAWQALIRERSAARPGTQTRSEVDILYFKVLPTITAIAVAVSDREIGELVQVANSQLKQRGQANHEQS
jgi:hypothetical protein